MSYKNPPSQSQWQKGESGNPNGRKPDKHIRSSIRELFSATAINKQGKTIDDKCNLDILLNNLLLKSVKGDMRATEILLSYGYGKPNQSMDINDTTEKTPEVSLDLSGVDTETLLKIVNSEKT